MAWLLLATVVVGGAAIVLVQEVAVPALEERIGRLATDDPARGLRELALVWYATFAVPAVVLGMVAAYLGRMARAVLREERFPPASMRLLHPMPVRRGEAARRRGRWLAIYAGVVTVVAVAILVLATLLHRRLLTRLAPGG